MSLLFNGGLRNALSQNRVNIELRVVYDSKETFKKDVSDKEGGRPNLYDWPPGTLGT